MAGKPVGLLSELHDSLD